MEQTDKHIGMLALHDYWYPFAGSLLHVVKTEPLPQYLGQPRRYAGGNHSEHGNLYTLAIDYGIWTEVRFACSGIYYIGAEHRH